MRPPALHLVLLLAMAAFVWGGCGGSGDGERAPRERADKAAAPPPGWRTVANRAAGFTVAVPRSWRVRRRRQATVVSSGDRRVAVTLSADRSGAGRRGDVASYARDVLGALPGFEGTTRPGVSRVRASPYRSALVRANGTVSTSPAPQLITVAVLRRPKRVTYSAIAFSDPAVGDAVVLRMLRTLRGRPPARPSRAGLQRSGRSG